ncbi:MAG: hypothetical protein FJ359_05680 [Thaumarchaeota archaeon]|nr:hypothetical protein [Nitrososphaerota archaeon]
MKQKSKKYKGFRKYAVIIAAILIISLTVFYSYTADQAKLRGFEFGNNLQSIQDDLKKTQTNFESKVTMLKENNLSKEEFLSYAQTHFQEMEELILRYDRLATPDSFVNSVKLFKLSTQTQLESDRQLIEWIKTGDDSAKVRSDSLFQESFEYEMAALSSYNLAKGQGT